MEYSTQRRYDELPLHYFPTELETEETETEETEETETEETETEETETEEEGLLSLPDIQFKPQKVKEVLSRLAGQVATAGGAFAVASFINLPPLPTTLASGIPPGK